MHTCSVAPQGYGKRKKSGKLAVSPVAYARVAECEGGRKSLLFKMKLRIRSEIVFYIFPRHVTRKKLSHSSRPFFLSSSLACLRRRGIKIFFLSMSRTSAKLKRKLIRISSDMQIKFDYVRGVYAPS